MDNKTSLDRLKGAYPKVFNGAIEVRTSEYVPGLTASLAEITYSDGATRTIEWTDRSDLHDTLQKLEENI